MLDPVGFWSYARHDDAHSDGQLSQLRVIVGKAIGLQYGAEVVVWQDIAAIPFGADWAATIEHTIDQTTFFMPIVTPRFLKSDNCLAEFSAFRKRMHALGRDDLIFPLYYVNVDNMRPEDTIFGSDLAALRRHQWIDFRPLFYADPRSPEVRRWAGGLAESILAALSRTSKAPTAASNAEAVDATVQTNLNVSKSPPINAPPSRPAEAAVHPHASSSEPSYPTVAESLAKATSERERDVSSREDTSVGSSDATALSLPVDGTAQTATPDGARCAHITGRLFIADAALRAVAVIVSWSSVSISEISNNPVPFILPVVLVLGGIAIGSYLLIKGRRAIAFGIGLCTAGLLGEAYVLVTIIAVASRMPWFLWPLHAAHISTYVAGLILLTRRRTLSPAPLHPPRALSD